MRKPQGPKCGVCQAVMHQVNGEGPFTCPFESSHEAILRMRAQRATEVGELNRGRRRRNPDQDRANLAKARQAKKKKKGKGNG